jgi:hypothetical protein
VSDRDFFFALDLSNPSAFDSMLVDVARAVFGHAGYAAQAVAELTAGVREAIATTGAGGPRRGTVRFQARAGELHVVVSFDGGGEWRASHVLP